MIRELGKGSRETLFEDGSLHVDKFPDGKGGMWYKVFIGEIQVARMTIRKHFGIYTIDNVKTSEQFLRRGWMEKLTSIAIADFRREHTETLWVDIPKQYASLYKKLGFVVAFFGKTLKGIRQQRQWHYAYDNNNIDKYVWLKFK